MEDDKNLGLVIRDFLEMSDYQVILKEDGKDGSEEFKNGVYDLILLDIMLPLLDGFSVAEEIRKTDCETPIIFHDCQSHERRQIKGFQDWS